jgi:hypothetical protein
MSSTARKAAILCLAIGAVALLLAHGHTAELLSASTTFDSRAVETRRNTLEGNLRKALADFDAGLAAMPVPAQAEWHAYLKWGDWAKPFLDGAAADAATMKRCSWRFYTAEKGFENPLILAARTALTDYLSFDEAVLQAGNDLEGEFQRRMARLQQAVGADDAVDSRELEAAAWWLAATGQGGPALREVQQRFNHPAIVLQVHRELIETKLDQFENTTHDVRTAPRRIQGNTVNGTSTIDSTVTAELIDDGEQAKLRITSRGQVSAPHNISQSGRVSVTSSSTSEFTVTSDLYFNGERFVMTPPHAQANTQSRIKSINAPRLIRRAAERRVQGSRAGAEREVESMIETEAIATITERMNRAIEKVTTKSENFLGFLTRTGNKAERWKTSLSYTAINLGFAPRSLSGLTAKPHQMPPLTGEQTLGLSIHDSGIESILRSLVGGKVWTDVNFSQLQRELTGGNSEEFMIGLEPERWNARWDWRQPVQIHFTREYATVRYRFSRIEIDGAAYEIPFEVSARMTVAAPPIGFEMTLLEPATVASVDPNQPLPPHFQAFLERKFRGLFGKKFALDGMQFPAGGALDGMSVFRVSAISLEPNWVHLRYTNRKPQARLVAVETETESTSASASP